MADTPEFIEKPTEADVKALISLMPSPVTATVFPSFVKPMDRIYLSSGVALAMTFSLFFKKKLLNILWSSSSYSFFSLLSFSLPTFDLNSSPVMQTVGSSCRGLGKIPA